MMGSLSDENESLLMLYFEDVTEAVNQMYNLASQIRSPKTRQTRNDVDLYKEVDGDIKSEYVKLRKAAELQGIEQILLQSRKSLLGSQIEEKNLVLAPEDQRLIQRLQQANHARRQQFEYWKRSKKRSVRAAFRAIQIIPDSKHDDEKLQKVLKHETQSSVQPSDITRSLLSSVPALPKDFVPRGSKSTYSGTSRGLTLHGPFGEKINWPKPPVAGPCEEDFECPFCFYFCTPRYSEDAAWRFVFIPICSDKPKTEDPGLDRTSSMTFDLMSVPTMSVTNQMCYTTAGRSGPATSNGRISKEYGDVWSILSLNTSSVLPMKIM